MWTPIVAALAASVALPGATAMTTRSKNLLELANAGVVGETEFGVANPSVHAGTTKLTPKYAKQFKSEAARVTYGPFVVGGMNPQTGGMGNFGGSQNFPMPCSDCTVLKAQSNLIYADGRMANANTSAWLHHSLIINTAEPDTVCGPSWFGRGNRWLSSGNERTGVDHSLGGHIPAGYYVAPGATHSWILELMNQAMYNQTMYMTIDYEYVKGFPSNFHKVEPIWLDITGCWGASDAPSKGTKYSYTSPAWTSQFDGVLIEMGGHLHDGGVDLDISKNGQTICNAKASYGGPGFVDGPNTMEISAAAANPSPFGGLFGRASKASTRMSHISKMSGCIAPTTGVVSKGDQWTVTANYDYTQHASMLNADGSPSDIMGISMCFIAPGMTQAQAAKYMKGVSIPSGESAVTAA